MQTTTAIAREMAARGTFRGPTLSAMIGIVEHQSSVPAYAVEKALSLVDDARVSHTRALRAGVRHVCSTDAGTPYNPHGNGPNELIAMVDWGMSPLAAMVAGTANGAELLRVPDIGRVAPGFAADLVLYDADPTEDIEALRSPTIVWKAGSGSEPDVRSRYVSRVPRVTRSISSAPRAIAASSSGESAARPAVNACTRRRRPAVRIRLPFGVARTRTPRASAGSGPRRTSPSRSRPSTNRVIVGADTPSAAASAPIPSGPPNTTTESADSRGGETPRASSSVRRRRNRCRAAACNRSATASTSRAGEVRLDDGIAIRLCLPVFYLLSLSK